MSVVPLVLSVVGACLIFGGISARWPWHVLGCACGFLFGDLSVAVAVASRPTRHERCLANIELLERELGIQ